MKQYYINNKEEISEKKKQYRLDKKEKTILSREEGAFQLTKVKMVVEGANLQASEYGNTSFFC